jgi:hypothetical protein
VVAEAVKDQDHQAGDAAQRIQFRHPGTQEGFRQTFKLDQWHCRSWEMECVKGYTHPDCFSSEG